MTSRGPVLLALVTLLLSGDGSDAVLTNHLDELLSLSELPLKNLLHVKRTFVDIPQEGK
jgi:hypothetical protein